MKKTLITIGLLTLGALTNTAMAQSNPLGALNKANKAADKGIQNAANAKSDAQKKVEDQTKKAQEAKADALKKANTSKVDSSTGLTTKPEDLKKQADDAATKQSNDAKANVKNKLNKVLN